MLSEADLYDVLVTCQLKPVWLWSPYDLKLDACVCHVWQDPAQSSVSTNTAWIVFSAAV